MDYHNFNFFPIQESQEEKLPKNGILKIPYKTFFYDDLIKPYKYLSLRKYFNFENKIYGHLKLTDKDSGINFKA